MADTWYLSFADGQLPKGQQFLGGLFIRYTDEYTDLPIPAFALGEADDLARVITATHMLGLNPGGEIQAVGPMPDVPDAYYAQWGGRLLTKPEVEAMPEPDRG